MGMNLDYGICYGVQLTEEEAELLNENDEALRNLAEEEFGVDFVFTGVGDCSEGLGFLIAGNQLAEDNPNIITNWQHGVELPATLLPNRHEGRVREFLAQYFPNKQVEFKIYLWARYW